MGEGGWAALLPGEALVLPLPLGAEALPRSQPPTAGCRAAVLQWKLLRAAQTKGSPYLHL